MANWNGFPRPFYPVFRGLQIALSIATLVLSVFSAFWSLGWLMFYDLAPLGLIVIWTILTFSLFLSGHPGPALMTTIVDCILGLAVLILTILTHVWIRFDDSGNPIRAGSVVAFGLNYLVALSLFATFGVGVKVHRQQEAIKRNAKLSERYGLA